MSSTKKWPGNETSGGAPIIAKPPTTNASAASGATVALGRSAPARRSIAPAATSCWVAAAPVTRVIAIAPTMPGPESVAMPTRACPRFAMTEYTATRRSSVDPVARNAPPSAETLPMPMSRSCTLEICTIAGKSPERVRISASAMNVVGMSTPK